MATVVFYAVDLEDLTGWAGRRDPRALEAARAALREDESDWEPQELELLDRLLARLVNEGQLYEGLNPGERYYLTQLLIDLFDEFVDSEAVSDDWPLEAVGEAAAALPREGEAARLGRFLTHGRALGSEALLREKNDNLDDYLPYFGYVSNAQLPVLAEALGAAPPRLKGRTAAAWKALEQACRSCIESEQDLLSFVG